MLSDLGVIRSAHIVSSEKHRCFILRKNKNSTYPLWWPVMNNKLNDGNWLAKRFKSKQTIKQKTQLLVQNVKQNPFERVQSTIGGWWPRAHNRAASYPGRHTPLTNRARANGAPRRRQATNTLPNRLIFPWPYSTNWVTWPSTSEL